MSEPTAFPPTANPHAYVPWRGAERALAGLERWAFGTRNPACVLAGGAGMGKTLLLKLFAARARDRFRTAFVSYPDCNPDDLCRIVAHEFGGVGSDDPQAALADVLRDPGARDVLLLIDEGERLPAQTARWLRERAARSLGALRVVFAVTRDERDATPVMIGDAECATVRIEGSMSRDEVQARVWAELERVQLEPALRARFDDASLAALFARSAGVPARVQCLSATLLYEAQRSQSLPRQTPALDETDRRKPAAVRDPAAVATPPPPFAAAERAVAATPVSVSINADPCAHIEVDGAAVGETPIAALALAPGVHRVVARMSDGRLLERSVEIDASNHRIVFP